MKARLTGLFCMWYVDLNTCCLCVSLIVVVVVVCLGFMKDAVT
jgi:hypothetical protein